MRRFIADLLLVIGIGFLWGAVLQILFPAVIDWPFWARCLAIMPACGTGVYFLFYRKSEEKEGE
jgi:hypothetical protein